MQAGQQIYLFSKMSRLTLGTTQPSVQWVSGAYSSEMKQLEHETDHPHFWGYELVELYFPCAQYSDEVEELFLPAVECTWD